MTTILLKRIAQTADGVFGVLMNENGVPFAVTAERPWNENKKSESCIPVGSYKCRRTVTKLHGEVYELQNVPDREAILIHIGNFPTRDSEGCILIGREFIDYPQPAILESRLAFAEFMRRFHDDLVLRIVEV